jgi:hypothetical protein
MDVKSIPMRNYDELVDAINNERHKFYVDRAIFVDEATAKQAMHDMLMAVPKEVANTFINESEINLSIEYNDGLIKLLTELKEADNVKNDSKMLVRIDEILNRHGGIDNG